MTTLPDFIALRKSLGLNRKAASIALGLHPNYISRVERAERPYKQIYHIALREAKDRREAASRPGRL